MPINYEINVSLDACNGPVRDGVARQKSQVFPITIRNAQALGIVCESAVQTLQQAWQADHISEDHLSELLAIIQWGLRHADG